MHLIDVSSARALLLSPPQTDMECLEFSFFVFFLKCGRLWNLNWKMIIQICRIQAKLMCDRLQSPALKPPAAGNPASSTGHAWQPTLRPMFSLGSGKSRADRIWGHSPLCCRNLKVGVKPDSKHWGAIHENLGHYMYIFKFTEREIDR